MGLGDPARAAELAAAYNEKFNSLVLRSYDDAQQSLPGLAVTFRPRPHQVAAVARMINEPAAGLFHEVGAGKTAEMIMGVTELRRLGLVRKPAVIIPNHMLEQFAREWLQLYPRAKVLVAHREDFQGDRRRRFTARCATGDWDGIIMSRSAFERIPLSPAEQGAYMDRELALMRTWLKAAQGGAGLTVKRLEGAPPIRVGVGEFAGQGKRRFVQRPIRLAIACGSVGKDRRNHLQTLLPTRVTIGPAPRTGGPSKKEPSMPDKVSPAKERLPGSEWLGWGFDALMGEYSTASCRRRILPELPTGPDVFSYGGLTYAIPRGVAVSRGSGRGNAMMVGSTFVAASQLELQEHFAARAALKGTYGSFTGELEVLYGYEREREQSCWYALIEGRLEGFRMAAGDLTPSAAFLADPSVAALTALQNPAFDPSGPELFYRVFRRWGTHIVTQVAGGASLEYAATVDRSAASDKQVVSAKLDLEYKAVLGDSSLQAKADWESLTKSWSASRQAKIATSGGTAGMMGVLAPTFNDNFSERYSDWLATLEQAPAVIDLRLQPLSAVFSNPQLAAEVQKAADAYLGNGIYVEASHGRENVAFVSVCGQTVQHDARQGNPPIAQLVVIDPKTLKVLVNNTSSQANVPPGDAHPDWSRLLSGTEKLTGSGYFCAVAVSDFYVSSYPSSALADWLRGYGASLESWPTRPVGIPGDHRICYAFVGQQGLRPKDGLERTEVSTSASPSHDLFASACAPLIPLDGTFGLPRAE